jgi:hypothetical protein
MRRDDDAGDRRDVGREELHAPKRPYAKPKIREYGSIAKLTQSGGSTRFEIPTMRSCL